MKRHKNKISFAISMAIASGVFAQNVLPPVEVVSRPIVEDVVIDNSMRGTGMGKILMDFIKDYSHKMSCYKIILDCSEHNIGFYEKCGFKINCTQMALYHSSL